MPQLPVIKTQNLTKYYGKHLGIKNLDLTVHSQEIFGFLGPNGAGKTTTIRLFLNLLRPTSGKVTIFGYDTQKQIEKIHDKIAYLPGELEFNKNWTAQRTINHMLNLYNHTTKPRIIQELAQTLKLDLNKKVKELSKGNKQKITIILVLAPQVELLILDEPTAGLDPLIKNQFYKLLSQKQANAGCTIFLSSHVLSEVEKIANRVAIINQGSIIEVATLDQLQQLALKRIEIQYQNFQEAKKNMRYIPENITKNIIQQHNKITILSTRKNLDKLLSWLTKTSFTDLDIRNPSLEDIFLEYYKAQPYEKANNNTKRGSTK